MVSSVSKLFGKENLMDLKDTWFWKCKITSYVCGGGNNEIYNHPYLKKYSKTTKRGYGVEIVLVVKNVAKLYEKVKDFVNVVEPLVIQPWGVSDFRIEDPFGFYIRISDPYNTLHPKYAIK